MGYDPDDHPLHPATRLGEASKQIHLATEQLDDGELEADLREAFALVQKVRNEVSSAGQEA